MSERQASQVLEDDQKKQLGEVVYPWNALRVRYQRIKSGTNRATIKNTPQVTSNPKPFTNAMQIAVFVISHLERIMADDPQREAALKRVNKWPFRIILRNPAQLADS
jgi:hypothetical protein